MTHDWWWHLIVTYDDDTWLIMPQDTAAWWWHMTEDDTMITTHGDATSMVEVFHLTCGWPANIFTSCDWRKWHGCTYTWRRWPWWCPPPAWRLCGRYRHLSHPARRCRWSGPSRRSAWTAPGTCKTHHGCESIWVIQYSRPITLTGSKGFHRMNEWINCFVYNLSMHLMNGTSPRQIPVYILTSLANK